MEVTHVQDHISHAVIGGGKAESFGISDDPAFFHVLSSTLYRDKKRAVIRETLCNAWDAHIEAGLIDMPIEVTLTDKKLTIQDFGPGIDKALIKPIYGVYGASTKKKNQSVTGGFGLGCKAPFAYVDHFEVISCHLGEKTVYRMSKSSGAVMGKPSILPILSVPTDDSGITVSMAIESSDFREFDKLIKQIAFLGEMKVKYNGQLLPTAPFSEAKHNYLMIKTNEFGQGAEHALQIRYGNVVYPIEKNDAYQDEFAKAHQFMKSVADPHGYDPYGRDTGNRYGWVLILQAQPDTISVTPSRESLSMTDHTIETVKALLTQFIENVRTTNLDQVCRTMLVKAVDTTFLMDVPSKLLEDIGTVPNRKAIQLFASPYITDVTHTGGHYLLNNTPRWRNYHKKDGKLRLNAIIQSGFGKRGLVQSFRNEYMRLMAGKKVPVRKGGLRYAQNGPQARGDHWFKRKVVKPLFLALQSEPLLDFKRLFVWHKKSYSRGYMQWGTTPVLDHVTSMEGYMNMLKGVVIVAYNRTDIEIRARKFPMIQHWFGDIENTLCYIVNRNKERAAAAVKFFEKQGWTVLDLTQRQAWEPVEILEPVKKEAPKTKRKKGYPVLAELGSSLDVELLWDEDANRLEQPEFYAKMNRKADSYQGMDRFSDKETSNAILRLWGDKGVAVQTSAQIQRLQLQNIPNILVYIQTKLLERYQNDDGTLREYHQKTALLDQDHHKDPVDSLGYHEEQLLKMVQKDPELSAQFKIDITPTQETLDYARLFRMPWYNWEWRDNKQLKEIIKIIQSWGVDPNLLKLIETLSKSKMMKIINSDGVAAALSPASSMSVAQKKQVREIVLSALKG